MNLNTTFAGLKRYRPLSLDSLKEQLLDELVSEYALAGQAEKRAQREANAAAALAWETPYPFLFLPELMEERIRTVATAEYPVLPIEIENQSMVLAA